MTEIPDLVKALSSTISPRPSCTFLIIDNEAVARSSNVEENVAKVVIRGVGGDLWGLQSVGMTEF